MHSCNVSTCVGCLDLSIAEINGPNFGQRSVSRMDVADGYTDTTCDVGLLSSNSASPREA